MGLYTTGRGHRGIRKQSKVELTSVLMDLNILVWELCCISDMTLVIFFFILFDVMFKYTYNRAIGTWLQGRKHGTGVQTYADGTSKIILTLNGYSFPLFVIIMLYLNFTQSIIYHSIYWSVCQWLWAWTRRKDIFWWGSLRRKVSVRAAGWTRSDDEGQRGYRKGMIKRGRAARMEI